jgi:AcrR family transcriptional regulator
MPRLSDTTRAQRRQHILTSAWGCFSRDGFHATSMDDIIGATGMSSSAVYRYFRSKEEIVRASAEEGVGNVRQIFVTLLDRDPCPDPAETLTHLVAELHRRTDNPDYDMTRLALQTWAETLRDPVLHPRTHRRIGAAVARQRVSATRCGHQSRCRHAVFDHARPYRDAPRRGRCAGACAAYRSCPTRVRDPNPTVRLYPRKRGHTMTDIGLTGEERTSAISGVG